MALGDMMGLMKQAAQLQTKMQEMQAELDRIEVEGTAGGGTVTLTAKGELKGVKIDDSLMKAEEKEILEDLLVAAHADGRRKAEAVMQEKMKSLTGGMPLPPGLKLF
jgi:DNA-binding YbaB/EbfC family protein